MNAPHTPGCPDIVPETCLTCGAVGLERILLHWSGRDADARRTGGVLETLQCPGCDSQFRRGTDGGPVPLHPPAR